jgi:hypothetical protein
MAEKQSSYDNVTVPEDTLPIFAGYNSGNGAAVFLLRGRGDAQTVQVTMQGNLGERRRRRVPEKEASLIRAQFGTDWSPGSSQVVDAQGQTLSERVPQAIYIDQRKPDPDLLEEFIGDDTLVGSTERASEQPS